jgi:tripartite-type tricarboxylate transporter receptor subunit TctC
VITRRAALLAGVPLAVAASARGAERLVSARPPILMFVGASEGSGADQIARDFASYLGPILGTVVSGGVEIQPRYLVRDAGREMLIALGDAQPTGDTIGWVSVPTLPARMIDHADPNLLTRIRLLGQVEREPVAFVSLSTDPANSVQDIIQRAGDDADAVPLATPPAGSPPHLAALRLQVLAQTRLNIVTFPSSAAARQAVLDGNVSAAALGLSEVIGGVQDGTLSALGIAAHRRFGLLPDAPVLDEAGIPLRAFIRRGVAVPDGTPDAVVANLTKALRAVTEDETFQHHAETNGYYAAWEDGAAWQLRMEQEHEVLAKLWATDPWMSASGG